MWKTCLKAFRRPTAAPAPVPAPAAAPRRRFPRCVFFIVANEFCERFNFYGMRTILALYLRNYTGRTEETATLYFHFFAMLCYFFPVVGAIVADSWWGKFKTILYLSLVYVSGSCLITLSSIRPLGIPQFEFSVISMVLVAIGTGGIKPCVAAFGGDQFKLPEQEVYLNYYFSIFYFTINAGSLASTFITPILRSEVYCFGEQSCYPLAFAVPGCLTVVSIIVFLAGRKTYKIVPPLGFNLFTKVVMCIMCAIKNKFNTRSKRPHWLDHADDEYGIEFVSDVKSLLNILTLFVPIPIFWALYDQQGSRWTFQADRMDQDLGGVTIKPDQMQIFNPFLILVMLPLFDMFIYPFLEMIKLVTKPTHKMFAGGIFAAIAFITSGFVELALVNTYETPLTEGYTQLRVYNGYNCRFILTTFDTIESIEPLGYYENLHVPVINTMEEKFNLQGVDSGTPCSDWGPIDGTFTLEEQNANSYFIDRKGVVAFQDDNSKPMAGLRIRFLINSNNVVRLKVIDDKNNAVLDIDSNNKDLHEIMGGRYDIIIEDKVVAKGYSLKNGGVYTVNVYGDNANNFVLQVAAITPWNSVHILWQIPQYVLMTIGEVMLSVTGLSFSFTQAPSSMKSVLQSCWLLTVTLGNIIIILVVEGHALDAQWKEFFLFAGLMFIDMLFFLFLTWRYKYKKVTSSGLNLPPDENTSPDTSHSESQDNAGLTKVSTVVLLENSVLEYEQNAGYAERKLSEKLLSDKHTIANAQVLEKQKTDEKKQTKHPKFDDEKQLVDDGTQTEEQIIDYKRPEKVSIDDGTQSIDEGKLTIVDENQTKEQNTIDDHRTDKQTVNDEKLTDKPKIDDEVHKIEDENKIVPPTIDSEKQKTDDDKQTESPVIHNENQKDKLIIGVENQTTDVDNGTDKQTTIDDNQIDKLTVADIKQIDKQTTDDNQTDKQTAADRKQTADDVDQTVADRKQKDKQTTDYDDQTVKDGKQTDKQLVEDEFQTENQTIDDENQPDEQNAHEGKQTSKKKTDIGKK